MINDDKPLLKITENGIMAFGTPWNGKHRLSSNLSVPLKAICVLTRDMVNHIERIEPREAYPILLQQVYRPMNAVSMIQTMKLVDKWYGLYPLRRLWMRCKIKGRRMFKRIQAVFHL